MTEHSWQLVAIGLAFVAWWLARHRVREWWRQHGP